MHYRPSLFRSALFTLALAACSSGGDSGSTQPPVTQSIGLQLSASSGTVARGASGTATLTLSRVGGYAGTVALTAENLPAGVTATFTPASLSGSAASATVVFNVGTTATAGSSTITIRAAGSGVTAATATYALSVPAPAVTLTAGSGAASIVVGGSATVPITIMRSNGFTDAVALAATGLPAGVTATFTPATIAAGSTTSTLTLIVAGTATPGASTVTISASGTGVTTQTASLALTLTAAATPAVAVAATPAAVSIVAGASGTTAIAVSRTGGFAGDVTLALEGAPAGVTGTFSANPVLSAATASTLTISTTGTAAPGMYNLTVRATGTGVTAATTTVAVTITAAPGITISTTPATVTVAAGSAVTTAVTITRLGGFAADVALAATGLPAGVSASFAPAALTGATLTSTLTLTSTTGAAVGASTVTVTASGTGVTAQTAAIALTVSAAPAYSLAATATTLVQGATSTSTVTVTRTGGFAGTVNLTIAGLPSGVSAVFTPAAVTGTSATVTFTAAANATTGAFSATITGTATGLANVTTGVSGSVTASGGGGGGSIAWRFCDPTDLPLFFAFRNGTSGAWTRVTAGANNTYSFSLSGLGSVAIARPLENGVASVAVYNLTATEMASTALQECTTNPPGKTLNGSFANLGAGQTGNAYLSGGIGTATGPATTFSMANVGDGLGDLLAFRFSTTIGAGFIPSLTPDRVVLRRNVNYAANSTMPVIDFTGAESFAPYTATYTTTGIGAGEISQSITSFVTSNGTSGSFLFGSLLGGTGTNTVYGVPSNRLATGDFHLVFSTSSAQDGNTTRGVFQYNRELANRTIALGGLLTTPTVVTAGTAPYVRLRASGPWQAEYNDALGVTFQQAGQGTSRSWTISSSRAFYGAAGTYSEEIPDLSGVSGFDNTWGLRSGVSTTTTMTASGGITGTIGVASEGSSWRFAARTSTITP